MAKIWRTQHKLYPETINLVNASGEKGCQISYLKFTKTFLIIKTKKYFNIIIFPMITCITYTMDPAVTLVTYMDNVLS